MPLASNERLRQILSNQSTVEDMFIIRALERILFELDPNAEDEILDELLPETPDTQQVMFGHKIGVYAGMNRQTIKDKFGLTDGNVDDIFAALGVTQGTALFFGGGGPTAPEAGAATTEDVTGETGDGSDVAPSSSEDGAATRGAAKPSVDKKAQEKPKEKEKKSDK